MLAPVALVYQTLVWVSGCKRGDEAPVAAFSMPLLGAQAEPGRLSLDAAGDFQDDGGGWWSRDDTPL